jgi:5'-nucleotidase / UDP-sugar diphosphatase
MWTRFTSRKGPRYRARAEGQRGKPAHPGDTLAVIPFAVRFRLALVPLLLVATCWFAPARAAEPAPEALLVVIGDSHSAYDKVAQLVAHIDRLKNEYRHVPLGVLVNGDAFEAGNVIARRSNAEIDLAFLAALAKRGPTILNLGNHELDFFGPDEVVKKLEATGVVVISGNLRHHATGAPLAPPSTVLKLGAYEAAVVGVVTERLSTFRKAIQPELDLADPAVWARQNFPTLLKNQILPIVLSHAGYKADQAMRLVVPPGTLFAGAHDHLRFSTGDYFHSGSWLEGFSLAKLRWVAGSKRLRWQVEDVTLKATDPADRELAAVVRRVREEHLTSADNAVVGYLERPLTVQNAGRFAAWAIAHATGADTGFIGNTTFGAGLPAGPVTQLDFDACVRFDGPVYTARVDGARLAQLLAATNLEPYRLPRDFTGEINFAGGERRTGIDPNKVYKIATSDWGAKNTDRYFGEPAIAWEEQPQVKLKAAVLAALAEQARKK